MMLFPLIWYMKVMIKHPESKATKGSEKLFVHVCITIQSITQKMNQRNNPKEEDTGKWKRVKHSLILATTVLQPLPAEAD